MGAEYDVHGRRLNTNWPTTFCQEIDKGAYTEIVMYCNYPSPPAPPSFRLFLASGSCPPTAPPPRLVRVMPDGLCLTHDRLDLPKTDTCLKRLHVPKQKRRPTLQGGALGSC